VHAQGHRSSATRYDARAIVDLPAPVQRYFRAVLKDGQPVIAAARIEMTGRMNMSATAEQWKPFSSQQRVVTRGPGFL
jgi:DNA-binding phage protein